MKSDTGKPQWWLLRGMFAALDYLTFVREYGVKKYKDPDNWQNVEDGERRYVDAAFRHLAKHANGERVDPESGLLHLGHAFCSVGFALAFALRGMKEEPRSLYDYSKHVFDVCKGLTHCTFTKADCIRAVKKRWPLFNDEMIEKHVDEFLDAYMAKPIVPVEDIEPRWGRPISEATLGNTEMSAEELLKAEEVRKYVKCSNPWVGCTCIVCRYDRAQRSQGPVTDSPADDLKPFQDFVAARRVAAGKHSASCDCWACELKRCKAPRRTVP